MGTPTHYSLGTHLSSKKSLFDETARCGLDSALNLAHFGCLILYGSSNWESNPMATVLRHIWLPDPEISAKRSHTHHDNPLPGKMMQLKSLGLAISKVAVNNGGVF